ncbi:Ribonucleotide reductase of class II (coenzyme B12-dependent) [hydrothermal vent metagenome]|uniref:Vitamin B12-dependent ribonucleotide reductase n=1 Tax=hydrothermal vent metagenome TaxID=652676 RepID=A0A3B1BVF2_9ZZZZ
MVDMSPFIRLLGEVNMPDTQIQDDLYNDTSLADTNIASLIEDAYDSTPDPGELISENALRVLERRYLSKDENGAVTETVEDLFRRVAKNIAQAEARYGSAESVAVAEKAFYGAMVNLEFLPNSPTLMNAGRPLQQLAACFVLPVKDSMESIFDAVRDTALIHKSGGGTGFSFSRLRPSGSRVNSTNGVSSGPVSFMRVFDAATESVKQGGTRRGANMGILRVDHPDIEDFIDCKKDNEDINNFNISVAFTEEFMKAVEADEEYNLVAPHNGEVTGTLKAKKIFDKIVNSAWSNGDPGIIFIDRINEDNPTPHIGEIESTNPCGEQPLLPYESCNLGSINLAKMVNKKKKVDAKRLRRVVHLAVRFLDNVIDMNKYPLDKIEKMTRANRKIGLGVMGWADMLIKMGIPYNSEGAIKLAEDVMKFIDVESKKASEALAVMRGPFPNFIGSRFDQPGTPKIRNATTTTIAPTGTISILAGASSGIEPLFALSFVRTVMDKDKLVEIHPLFEKAAQKFGFYSEDLMEKVSFHGHIENEEDIPEDIRKIFITAHGVKPEWHVKMQAAFQKHTDNAVSKTVNFPFEATKEDVSEVYMLAYNTGCKGVTIYRDGSRSEQVLSTGATHSKGESAPGQMETPEVQPRPDIVYGSTQRVNTGCGNMYVTINHTEDGTPLELFSSLGKAGGCAASQTESIGRLVSLALRAGVDIDEIRSQLIGVSCHQPAWENGMRIASCADAIGKAIGKLELAKQEKAEAKANITPASPVKVSLSAMPAKALAKALGDEIQPGGACPDCGGSLQHVDGCLLCGSCGYSKC